MMYQLLRPALFRLPPHAAHELAFLALSLPEHVAPLRRLLAALFQAPGPRVQALGLSFPNPVGVAGGFDKDGRCPLTLAALGFGFLELGTVTAQPQQANPSPNLFRLPQDSALLNRLGFPNRGAAALAQRLQRRRPDVPVAISIGKSRSVPVEDLDAVIADYTASFDAVSSVADFVVINVSSPNTANLRAIQRADAARALLSALVARRPPRGDHPLPLLLKVSPDLPREDYEALLDVVDAVGLDGVVATNTTVSRDGLRSPASWVASLGPGGISGPPLRERARSMIALARRRLPRATLIGVGGISSVDHARAMLDAGADLLQLYTGFIYEGPSLPGRLARGLLTSSSPPFRLHSRPMGTGHTHHHRERRAWWVVLITLTMMIAELVVGYLSRSMALTADGWHMGTHALALALTALAYWYARTRATPEDFPRGTHKINTLAGFTSSLLLSLVALGMFVESIRRLLTPEAIHFNEALGVAVLGLLVNAGCAFLLQGDGHDHGHGDGHGDGHEHGHEHGHGDGHEHGDGDGHEDHNLKAAYLHVVADALTSVLAIAALLAGKYAGLTWLDPVTGLVGGGLVLRWGVGLSRETARILLDMDPRR